MVSSFQNLSPLPEWMSLVLSKFENYLEQLIVGQRLTPLHLTDPNRRNENCLFDTSNPEYSTDCATFNVGVRKLLFKNYIF